VQINESKRKLLTHTLDQLQRDRYPFWTLWREIADFFLPKRYVWLQSDKERRVRNAKNPFILDSTGTRAARILASGMMNGITRPSAPWFTLSVPGYDDDGGPIQQWADEVTRRMMVIMAESNFYNAMAVLYLDLVTFGTAAVLIYEDTDTVIRCYNPALGEFYLAQDFRLSVNTFAREFKQTVHQIVSRWGKDNVSDTIKQAWTQGGARLLEEFDICHLIQPNNDGQSDVPSSFQYRETYWEKACQQSQVLDQRGFHELPGIFPRWELTANDAYGTSPAMDALPDVIQLQQETKRKAQGLDKMINPPIIADVQLQHRPTALLPNGITYIAGANNVGVKPLYQITPPLGEITKDIQEVQQRIQLTFHNDLFQMISQLETVRSATEIAARQEEKLVLLGSVLERFENEALDPAITRIFAIMNRSGLLPEAPPEIADQELAIQYVSILSTAQRAVAAIPTERWLQVIGNISGVAPQVLNVPNFEELIRNSGLAIGVQARDMHTREEIEEISAAQAQKLQQDQAMAAGKDLIDGAQTLSQTDVGGGANALQQVLQ